MVAALAVKPMSSYDRIGFDHDLADWRPVLCAPPARRAARAVYFRRRLLAVGLLLIATAAALVLVRSAGAGAGGGTLTPAGAAATSSSGGALISPADATSYVVRPGDTLWTIAHALDPDGDERPLVQRLATELGGATLYPGETIPVPAGS